jgi:hypothetical protein
MRTLLKSMLISAVASSYLLAGAGDNAPDFFPDMKCADMTLPQSDDSSVPSLEMGGCYKVLVTNSLQDNNNTLVINEDANRFQYDINISGSSDNDVDVKVDINDTSILAISPLWNGLLANSDYNGKLLSVYVDTMPNAYGDINFSVEVSSANMSYTENFTITVNPVDDPIELDDIANKKAKEDSRSVLIDLSSIDMDNDVKNAVYTASSSDTDIAEVKIIDGKLLIIPQRDANGEITIEVNATLNGTVDTKTFTYTLEPENDRPTIESIADINLNQSTSAQSGNFLFDIWDDVSVTKLTIKDDKVNDFDVKVTKVDETTGKIEYSIPANYTGLGIFTVTANDGEYVYNEKFNIAVKPENDALCVEDMKTAITFDTVKGNNHAQNYVRSDLFLVDSLPEVCGASIKWESSDTSVLETNGTIYIGDEDRTISAIAYITKGEYETKKQFLITVPKAAITDEKALANVKFEDIRESNERRDKILSDLLLITQSYGKDVTWTSDDNSVIDPYTGVVTRGSSDANITLTAKIGTVTKDFNLTVLKMATNDEIVKEDKEWLSFERILDKNRDNNNIVYNLIKPLPSLTPNGSVIEWETSNENVITIDGDVFRDELVDKYVVLTATIDSDETKEFKFRVPKYETKKEINTTFKRVEDNSTNVAVVFDTQSKTDATTAIVFDAKLSNKIEKIINDNSIKSIIELDDRKLNLYLNTDGTSMSQTEFIDENNNSVISSITVDVVQSSSSVDENGTLETIIPFDTNTTIKATLNSDGSVMHIVEKDSSTKVSKAVAKIPGSKVLAKDTGEVETTSQIQKDGFIIKAIALTNKDGTTKTKFVKINLTTGEQSNVANTLSDDTPYEAGNEIEISDIENIIYIRATAPLGDDNLVVE